MHLPNAATLFRHWRVKGVVQKCLSLAPGGARVNARLQRTFGELRDPRANFDAKLADWERLTSLLAQAGLPRVAGLEMLEIGSGWYPTIPMLFALAGARRVHTFDIVRQMDEGMTRRLLDYLATKIERIAGVAGREPGEVGRDLARIRAAAGLSGLLREAGIEYLAPADARASGLAAGAIDVVFSNSVLEHVDPAALPGLMAESRRLIGNRGLTVHAVACNDHYAHFDPAISFVNYLRFEDRAWRIWNNDLNYQNRLRACDFVDAARSASLEIIVAQRAVRPGTEEALACLPVASRFARYSREDLATTSINFVARSA